MRPHKNEQELIAQENPVMYTMAQLRLIDGLRSSFPNWHGAAYFDWRNGWTRLGDFFADGYFLKDQMRELVHNRFGVNIP